MELVVLEEIFDIVAFLGLVRRAEENPSTVWITSGHPTQEFDVGRIGCEYMGNHSHYIAKWERKSRLS